MKNTKAKLPDDQKTALEGKVQVDGQEMAKSDSMQINSPSSSDTTIKEVDEPKSAINTKKAADAVAGGQDSTVGGVALRGAVLFSGSAGGNIKGDMSATSKETRPYKSGDKSGRRADPITRKLDYLDAEIIKTKTYQSKPLNETDEKQGYNGNYFNEHVITQRASGGVPADPIFERSVDEIAMDMLYYPKGQFVKPTANMNLSIHNWNDSANSGAGGYDNNPVTVGLGNYLHTKLTVKVGSDGTIKQFDFTKTDLTAPKQDEPTVRASSDAYLRFENQTELDRVKMVSVAGNESDPAWSPLGDAIIDSSDQNRLINLLESMAGDFTAISGRKLATALSYQINKSAKDGSRTTGPMSEMVNGCIPLSGYGADGYVSETNGRNYAFSKTAYAAGGAGLWLALNDSLPKYTTKGKMLSLPLSFKSAYATFKSNANPLKVDDLLISELMHNELFSTIDGPYDPLKPIVITDKVGLVYPIPLDLGCTTLSGGKIVNDGTVYTMHYENLRNKYNIRIRNYFTMGLFRWFDERGLRLHEALRSGSSDTSDKTVVIPIVSSTTSLSLWDLIVCSATPYIIEERLNTMTELLKYERNHGYPYTGLSAIGENNIDACDNYAFSDIESQLTSGIAKPIAAIKVIFPEVFWPVRKFKCEDQSSGSVEGTGAYVVLPHYFNQNQFVYDDETAADRKLLLSDDFASMSYPTTRSGNMLAFSDTIYGMTEEDYRLALDRMTVYPAYEGAYSSSKFCRLESYSTQHKNDAATYKYGLSTDGIPVLSYFAYAADAADKAYALTVADVLSTPRELGLMQVAPAGVLTPIRTASSTLNLVALDSSFLGLSGPGFRAKLYHATDTTLGNTILDAGSVQINNNASLRYIYDVVYSSPYDAANADNGLGLYGTRTADSFVPFVVGSYDAGAGSFTFATGTYNSDETKVSNNSGDDISGATIGSRMRYIWTRLQRLPFAISPFDCNTADLTNQTTANINNNDIFDFMYFFGLAGFRASDYRELVNLRSKERIAKGMNYTIDPFVAKSMLLK